MTFTTPDLLDLNVPVRHDRFVYELWDASHQRIGELDVSIDQAPSVSVNTQSTAMRSMSGLTLIGSDLSYIDPLRDRVAPFMVLQNGERFPLGVYMFGQQNIAAYSWGAISTPEMIDESFLIDQPLDTTASLPVGGSCVDFIISLLGPLQLPAIMIEASDRAAASPLVYRPGSSRLAAVTAAGNLLGCFNPFFDNAGRFRFKLPPAVDATPNHQYPWGSRVIDGTTKLSSAAYKLPNRFVVASDNTDEPLIGIYDLPASAPHSREATGRTIVTTRTMQGLATKDAADEAAYLDALTYNTPYDSIEFDSTIDPRHGVFDTLAVNGESYLETAWSITCKSGGTMRHQGSRLWR